MEITIESHLSAESFLACHPNEWDVVVITNAGTVLPEAIQKYAKSFLHLIFDDVEHQMGNYILPSKKDVRDALDFSVGKEKILVSCHAGISRSSAMAYAIKCKECGNPREAILVLTPIKHYPNRVVVQHASEVLDNDLVYTVYNEWLQKPVFNVRDNK